MTNKEAIEIIKAYEDRLTNSCSNQLGKDICAFELAVRGLRTLDTLQEIIKSAYERGMADALIEDVDKHIVKTDKMCKNCAYRVNNYGYSQCYAQKNAPTIENLNGTCERWRWDEKRSDE